MALINCFEGKVASLLRCEASLTTGRITNQFVIIRLGSPVPHASRAELPQSP